jgi:hypothetical protein
MKFFCTIILLLPLCLKAINPGFQTGNTTGDTIRFMYESPADFITPESVKYDNVNKILYVANINGKPSEKDGNGFISKLSPEGKILQLYWVDGLNAPKGMGIFNNKLYVTDIDRLAEIDINTGEIIRFYPAEGAQFLNDIDVDEQGNVYVSDMAGNCIWRLNNQTFEKWLESADLNRPNGLFINTSGLFVGCKNEILRVNTETKQIGIYANQTGGIDGLEEIRENTFIFSDWSGHIHILSPDKTMTLVLNTADMEIQAADIEYSADENLIFVPTFFHNTVSVYKIIKK